MDEQRKSGRTRTVLRATIIFNNRNSSIDCVVRNFSDVGAKIVIDESIGIPQQFELSVPQKGRSYLAKVVWRTRGETGIEFANELVGDQLIPVGHDLASQLRELKRENAALKKKCADLQNQINRYMEVA